MAGDGGGAGDQRRVGQVIDGTADRIGGDELGPLAEQSAIVLAPEGEGAVERPGDGRGGEKRHHPGAVRPEPGPGHGQVEHRDVHHQADDADHAELAELNGEPAEAGRGQAFDGGDGHGA